MRITREVALKLARDNGVTEPSSSALNRFAQAVNDLSGGEITKLREQVEYHKAYAEEAMSGFNELMETKKAQAAVIERMRWYIQGYCTEHWGKEALAIPTDSTQILAEVCLAERERVAQMILNGRFLHDESPAAQFAKEVAAAIRAME